MPHLPAKNSVGPNVALGREACEIEHLGNWDKIWWQETRNRNIRQVAGGRWQETGDKNY